MHRNLSLSLIAKLEPLGCYAPPPMAHGRTRFLGCKWSQCQNTTSPGCKSCSSGALQCETVVNQTEGRRAFKRWKTACVEGRSTLCHSMCIYSWKNSLRSSRDVVDPKIPSEPKNTKRLRGGGGGKKFVWRLQLQLHKKCLVQFVSVT